MKKLLLMPMALLDGNGTGQSRHANSAELFTPPAHVWCDLVKDCKRVEEVTEGRVSVVVPPKSLAPLPEQLNSVRSGFDAGFAQRLHRQGGRRPNGGHVTFYRIGKLSG